MPSPILIPFPSPRLAKNLYEPLSTFQDAVGIDLLDNTRTIRPFSNATAVIANPTSAGATDMNIRNSIRASDNRYYVVGSATIAASTNIVLFRTVTLSSSPTWVLDHNIAGTPSDALCMGGRTTVNVTTTERYTGSSGVTIVTFTVT